MGAFAQVFAWPIIPIHLALASDGRVMSYGTDQQGEQGGLLYYAIWDPALGERKAAVTTYDNTTQSDLFCSAATVLPDGRMMIAGGDYVINGYRNNSNADTTILDMRNSQLKLAGTMAYRRWYPSLLALADGRQLVAGGRTQSFLEDPAVDNSAYLATTPEVYENGSWRSLPGANSNAMFGLDFTGLDYSSHDAWFYPRIFSAPNGRVFGLAHTGQMFDIDPSGTGAIRAFPNRATEGGYAFPSVMYQPGRILSVRRDRRTQIIDLASGTPAVTDAAAIDAVRWWASGTILADGRVMVSGGSTANNDRTEPSLRPAIWDPATGAWSSGAAASRARLYHSAALLMPDGTVLTGGGGAPGPFMNLDAEVYYPSYLFKRDGSGTLATRPVIAKAPTTASWGARMSVTMGDAAKVSRVAFARLGSSTHSVDTDQRYVETSFAQTGDTLDVQVPADRNALIPGYYMLFVFDAQGVPAVAQILNVG